MLPTSSVLRIARPTDQLAEIVQMYVDGFGFEILGQFQDHDGFDGVIIGHRNHPYHVEFTSHQGATVGRAPTKDNLLVFYVPSDTSFEGCCCTLKAAGFLEVDPYNPYWGTAGKTFEDLDGYRVVLQNSKWSA